MQADSSVRAIVLCGDGHSSGFITHFSVETLARFASTPESARESAATSRGYHALLDGLNQLPQTVVVAMNGDTMGGGFDLYRGMDAPLATGLSIESGYFQETMPSDAGHDRMRAYLGQPEDARRAWRGSHRPEAVGVSRRSAPMSTPRPLLP